MRWFQIGILVCGSCFLLIAPFLLGKAAWVVWNRDWSFEVNGVPVQGERLDVVHGYWHRRIIPSVPGIAPPVIVTIHNEGQPHSYRLYFETDSDFTGIVGGAIDCGDWVAPRLPFWFATFNYPCRPDRARHSMTIRQRPTGLEFVTNDQARITMTWQASRISTHPN